MKFFELMTTHRVLSVALRDTLFKAFIWFGTDVKARGPQMLWRPMWMDNLGLRCLDTLLPILEIILTRFQWSNFAVVMVESTLQLPMAVLFFTDVCQLLPSFTRWLAIFGQQNGFKWIGYTSNGNTLLSCKIYGSLLVWNSFLALMESLLNKKSELYRKHTRLR